jgi:hypothetical protein
VNSLVTVIAFFTSSAGWNLYPFILGNRQKLAEGQKEGYKLKTTAVPKETNIYVHCHGRAETL